MATVSFAAGVRQERFSEQPDEGPTKLQKFQEVCLSFINKITRKFEGIFGLFTRIWVKSA